MDPCQGGTAPGPQVHLSHYQFTLPLPLSYTTQNIECPSIMTPWKLDKTAKDNLDLWKVGAKKQNKTKQNKKKNEMLGKFMWSGDW